MVANIDGEKLRGIVRGLAAADQDSTSKTRADNFSVARFSVTPALAALTVNTTSTSFCTVVPYLDRGIRPKALRVMSTSGTQATAAADGWTFALKYDSNNGAGTATCISFTTTTTAIASTFQTVGVSGGNVAVPAGSRLFITATAVNTAAAANAMSLQFSVEYDET